MSRSRKDAIRKHIALKKNRFITVQTEDATRDNLPSITQEEFAQIVLERIANAGQGREIKYDPTAFTLTLASGDQLFLGRVYSEYHSAKYSREVVLQNVVDAWLRPPDTFHGLQEAAPVLWPSVRHRLSFHMPIPGPSLVPHQLLGRHLALGIATAHGTTLKLVDQETLDRWGVTFSDALTVALRHLRSEATREDFVALSQGVYRSLRRDSFGGALLCPDILDRLAIKGAPVVVAPNRHTLLVTGADDAAGLQAVASLAKSELDDPHQQTGTPITFVSGNWVDFELPLDHPAYPLFREHERQAASGAYWHQSNLLAAYQRENGDDAIVSGIYTQQDASGATRTFSVWMKGAPALLGHTDDIFFVEEIGDDKATCTVAQWERAREVVGNMMKPMGIYPERYRVEDFPAHTQLAAVAIDGSPMTLDKSVVIGRRSQS